MSGYLILAFKRKYSSAPIDLFGLEDFQLSEERYHCLLRAGSPGLVPEPPKPTAFVKGPIPLPWYMLAGLLPGPALLIGLECWRLKDVTRQTVFQFEIDRLLRAGVNRKTIYRALSALARAKLIRIVRKRGGKPWVRIDELVEKSSTV
jgi:hypothetical protein